MRCPECGYASADEGAFDAWYCPSYPDKCDGCEVDPAIWRCEECWHEWKKAQECVWCGRECKNGLRWCSDRCARAEDGHGRAV